MKEGLSDLPVARSPYRHLELSRSVKVHLRQNCRGNCAKGFAGKFDYKAK